MPIETYQAFVLDLIPAFAAAANLRGRPRLVSKPNGRPRSRYF